MPRRAPYAALAALLAAPCQLAAQAGPAPGAGEVVTLVDKVIADPSDDEARVRLNSAARRAAVAETAAAEAERAALLAEAKEIKRSEEELVKAIKRRLAAWKKRFSKACSLASDADTSGEAVSLYERLLESFPVYSGNKKMLPEARARIMAEFLKTIRRSYPYLAEGRESADERMLAALQFSRVSERQSAHGGLPPSGVAEAQLRKARRLRGLELSLKHLQEKMDEGRSLFSRKRWSEAAANFQEVLDFDRENEEALHYHSLAEAKISAASRKR